MRAILITTTFLIGAVLILLSIPDTDGRRSLLSGLADPLLGLDHFLALLLVGIWAGRLRGPDTWKLPAAFLAGMIPGFVLAVDQVAIPLADTLVHIVIVGSLLSIAAAILIPIRMPTSEAITTVAMIGGCHGYVHGGEVGVAMIEGWFGLGALLTASILTAAGVAAGLFTPRAA